MDELRGAFPELGDDVAVTSDPSVEYNCIAWAAGNMDRWWWPDAFCQYYWPPEVDRDESIDSFVRVFQHLGYEPCVDAELETGVERVAIFALHGAPTHAARQLPNGHWTSKLGRDVDISHSLAGLVGANSPYGQVVVIMKRRIIRSAQEEGVQQA